MAKKRKQRRVSNLAEQNLKKDEKIDSNVELNGKVKKAISNDISEKNITLQKKETKMVKLKDESQQKVVKSPKGEESLRNERLRLKEEKTEITTMRKEFNQEYDDLKKEEELFKLKEENFKKREEELFAKMKSLEIDSEKLRKREQNIQESEIKRDEGFTEERKALDDELLKKRSDFDKEISELRIKRTIELDTILEKENKSRIYNLEKELTKKREKFEKDLSKQRSDFEKFENKKRSEIEINIKELKSSKQKILDAQDELTYKTSRLDSRDNRLDQKELDIDIEINKKTKARELSYEEEVESLKREIERLNNSISEQREIFSIYDELKQRLGGEEPEKVLSDLNSKTQKIKNLKEELLTRPTQEIREKYDENKNENKRLNKKVDALQTDYNKLQTKFGNQREIETKLHEKTKEYESLERKYKTVDESNVWLENELSRIKTSFAREQEKDERIKEIESPYIYKNLERAKPGIDEVVWLNLIERKFKEYEFKIHPRILKSFHTALKTAEFSPLTILSGVSGTGKSELPRLYSYFGGLNFLPLAVKPNWDSPESMLGFFNSIDNRFDAQPLLQVLAQSQKTKTDNYPCGLDDVLTIILLDEMNLAHVELYFSDFLSKLELRRGKGKNDVPFIDVKLGARLEPYQLKLGRNVLWTGTMNQDETTKSLSDKVLDRGIEINFPRPTQLISKKKLIPIDEFGKSPLLSIKDWNKWKQWEIKFTDEEIKPFKSIIEDINTNLTNVGRALGHRVWQSIEYYLANYPDVIVAKEKNDKTEIEKTMRLAFEDQLVQKVMPKLRGIETRGKSRTECLDKIKAQFVENEYSIVEDFEFACEYGYGQFMWNSAKYLDDDKMINSNTIEEVIKEAADIEVKSNEKEEEVSLDSSESSEDIKPVKQSE